ncbi:hypothetical protein ILUMI_12717 [Ignelater luminosus]|uniref:Uncharacterized protein n=1 Tax=Ignelater luminosus TaxID=2038154 RepID=A0A8K0G9B0_IGNLU|nr:hypothetical protein ILUMI_12717 [Ignelater luminosus]
MMLAKIRNLICLLFISGVVTYWQTDYSLKLERMELEYFDKHYLTYANVKSFKINRTHAAINFTFNLIKNMGFDLKVLFYFHIIIRVVIIQEATGNFTVCNWGPDYSRFPPYIPGGRYKADISFFYKSVEFAMFSCYTEVKPKERWEM